MEDKPSSLPKFVTPVLKSHIGGNLLVNLHLPWSLYQTKSIFFSAFDKPPMTRFVLTEVHLIFLNVFLIADLL